MGKQNLWESPARVKRNSNFAPNQFAINVRAADAKEVGVGNPAEETFCHPNRKT
jgi:hypothetical protein